MEKYVKKDCMKGMFRRKAVEIGSALYRNIIFPFKRCHIEIKTKSLMRPGSYISDVELEGRNYIGRYTYLKHCRVGYGTAVHDSCTASNTKIGKYSGISAGFFTILGIHPTARIAATHPAFYSSGISLGYTYCSETVFDAEKFVDEAAGMQISIGNDVWIGNGVKAMEGVTIGDGAVVGAGAMIVNDIPPYAVAVGVPAKIIRYRYTEEQIEILLRTKWWDKGEKWISEHIDDFKDIEKLIHTLENE